MVTSEELSAPPKLKDIGTYTITATLKATNYKAEEVKYTVTIGTGEQAINLTPVGAGNWVSGSEGQDPTMTVTLGTQESFTVTGKGTVDPSAEITYAVSEEKDTAGATEDVNVIDVDTSTPGTPGKMLIKGAGTATVTVSAGQTDKVDATSTTYQVTVEKGDPVINTDFEKTYTFGTAPDEMTDYTATLASPGFNAPKPTGTLAYRFYKDEEC